MPSLIDFDARVANVPTVIGAHVLMYDIALLKERHCIVVDCRRSGFGGRYHPNFSNYSKKGGPQKYLVYLKRP